MKNNIITACGGSVVYLSDPYEGKIHDKKIVDIEDYRFPPGSKLLYDLGYQGYEPKGVTIVKPNDFKNGSNRP